MNVGDPEDKIQAIRIAVGIGDTQRRPLGKRCYPLKEYISFELAASCIVRAPRPEDRGSAMYPDPA